jgi:hypothetical protein
MDEQLWPIGESGGDPGAYSRTYSNSGARASSERHRVAESHSSANAQPVSDAHPVDARPVSDAIADACPDSLP